MNFRGEHVPIKDFGQFHQFRKRLFQWKGKSPLGRCMHWGADCQNAISSHSISRCWLERIEDVGHIYRFRITDELAGKDVVKVKAELQGINEASVFPGFCSQHDSEIFKEIDLLDFVPSVRSCLLLAYRSVCFEACAKHQVTSAQLEAGMMGDGTSPHAKQVGCRCFCVWSFWP